jgi:hypothetical protein
MTKKYTNGALWRCLKAYPDPEHFKLFMGQCYIMGFTRARFMEDIIRNYFKAFTPSQREHLLKKYDESFLLETIEHWHDLRKKLSHERLHFLYSRIKYRKIMRLNVPFNEQDYNWPLMSEAFDFIFTGNNMEFMRVIEPLSGELKNNLTAFFQEVKAIREKYNK